MEGVRLLSTKKLLPNHRQYLLNAGLAVIEADFITINYKDFVIDVIGQNFIFTSANAFKSFLLNEAYSKISNNKIFCVGSKTRELIEEKGFVVTASADYAADLGAIIIKDFQAESFTFFSGSMRKNTLPEALATAGVAFTEVEVYETLLTPHKLSATVNGILFYSPSGVDSYLKKNKIISQTCFCIGTTTAEALRGIADNIVLANKPTVENVIVQCINYYKNINLQGFKNLAG